VNHNHTNYNFKSNNDIILIIFLIDIQNNNKRKTTHQIKNHDTGIVGT